MSPHKEHLIRLEEEFEIALDEGDYQLCNRLIAEVDESGHRKVAERMIEQVENTPVNTFAKPTPYVA